MMADVFQTRTPTRQSRGRGRQKGQSLVEFAISSLVLILLLMGLLDLSRAFYYSVNLQGAAREGARHGAWFDTATRTNKYLDDADVMLAVKQAMAGAGFDGLAGHLPIPTQVTSAGCLVGADGNALNNKPYSSAAVPASTGRVNVYICYTQPGGVFKTGTLPVAPTDSTYRLGDINVSIVMNFALVTPFLQNMFGSGLPLVYNEHFTIQGQP
ncbi:MAG TPA: TadE/TadG family type IV pilus assembly protein [Candidatus Dormibacteraeota bacterium]|jgi:Flp pilus assembly protein TadG